MTCCKQHRPNKDVLVGGGFAIADKLLWSYSLQITNKLFIEPQPVVKAWVAQHNVGIFSSDLGRDTQSVMDILRFVLTFGRRHKAKGKIVSATCTAKLDMWRQALVAWIAKLADKTVLALYLDNGASRDQLAPSTRFNRPDKRKYTQMSHDAKWAVLQDARAARTNPVTVLALRSEQSAFGCHKDAADAWMRKEQAMYRKGTCIVLSSGASHASYIN